MNNNQQENEQIQNNNDQSFWDKITSKEISDISSDFFPSLVFVNIL